MITETLKEDFYIRIYFNVNDGFDYAGLRRAYLDFNRTLKIQNKDQIQRNSKRNEIERKLNSELKRIISVDIKSQDEFDDYHKKTCLFLVNEWNELTIGQAQKWINMTLKYWLLFGNKRIDAIEKNAQYFHIPIDRYVQKGMFDEKNPNPWSKILDYDAYFEYQKKHRKKNTGNPPIVDEFEFFNQS